MPPANSLQGTPSLSPAAPASASRQPASISFSIPPEFTTIGTITSRTEDEDEGAHDDNVNFLRTNARSSPESSLSHQHRRRQQYPAETEGEQMDLDNPWGLRLNSDMGSRIRWVNRHGDELSSMPNYEGRTSEIRSLYGWAPDDDTALDEWLADDADVSRSSMSPWRHSRREPSGRNSSYQPLDSGSNRRPSGTIVPTETLLQSVRRHPRFSRARTLHHYLLERDRDRDRDRDWESEDRERSAARAYRFLPTGRNNEIRNLFQTNPQSRSSLHRQMYPDHPPSPRLKETIKYLENLRESSTLEERITSAAAIGYFHLDYFQRDEDDFILDTASIAPPAECSWLRPGMVFSGSQRAARTCGSIISHHPHAPNDPVIVNGSEPGRVTVHTSSGRRYLPQNLYRLGGNKDENWPVKVTIHSIDYNDMTLAGTMEAYNIPDKTTPTPDAHIITFLEGEIIDFNQHTLETGKFRADAETDSTYWRELHPFKDLTDDEVVKNLVSKKWITEELSKQWILMRWKEQCFVTPPRDSQSRNLTISGFYYICLRRDNGHIEGLYYDPVSSPYQQLSLHPQSPRMACPSYKFR